ncbi:unnamed protein product [Rhizophagus irregularis]|nr:unnamed protein product [Rhizophagus irregularis]CAB4419587.1 unnamed protein product [Rhizophagus irregularis]
MLLRKLFEVLSSVLTKIRYKKSISPDGDSEESKAITIKLSIISLKKIYKQKGSLFVKNLLRGGMKTIQIVKSQLILLIIAKMKILQAIMSTGVSMEIEIRAEF